MDHIRRETLDLSLVRVLILDEADEMLDMGFLEDIEYILEHLPAERQTALFPPLSLLASAFLSQKVYGLPGQRRDGARVGHRTADKSGLLRSAAQAKLDALCRIIDVEATSSRSFSGGAR